MILCLPMANWLEMLYILSVLFATGRYTVILKYSLLKIITAFTGSNVDCYLYFYFNTSLCYRANACILKMQSKLNSVPGKFKMFTISSIINMLFISHHSETL